MKKLTAMEMIETYGAKLYTLPDGGYVVGFERKELLLQDGLLPEAMHRKAEMLEALLSLNEAPTPFLALFRH